MARGGTDKYYNPSTKVVSDGDVAYADDLNDINYAVDSAFAQIADDLDEIDIVLADTTDYAEGWAISPQGTPPDALQPGLYSSRAYSIEAKEYTSNSLGSAIHKADGTTVMVDSANVSAAKASTSAITASSSATTATTQAGVATTQAGLSVTARVASEAARDSALVYKNAAATSATNAATSETSALNSKNAAATSATSAATSATNADTSEANAASSATAAATSATNAATSATSATTSKNAAATSAANAYTSEINAGTNATLAAVSAAEAAAAADYAVGISKTFRNKIINGNFDFWQRGLTQSTNGYGSDDRWLNSNIGTTKVHSLVNFTPGQTAVPDNPVAFSRTMVTSVAGAANLCYKTQKIEGVNTLAGKTITLSFWAKADASRNIAIEFSQNFGTGGSPSATVLGIEPALVPLTTTWQKQRVTVAIPSIFGKTIGTDYNDFLQLILWFDAGSNYNSRTASLGQQSGYFDIAHVQFEEGSDDTPFENRPVGIELSLCQRYYQIAYTQFNANVTTGIGYRALTNLPVNMRAVPTLGVTDLGGAQCFPSTAGTPAVLSSSTFYEFRTANLTGAGFFRSSVTIDAEL